MDTLSDTLFHMPWWIAAFIILIAGGLFYVGNRRQDKTLQRVGFAAVLIALLLGTVGFLYLTDRQKLEIRTRQIITAVDKADWAKLDTLLDQNTAVGTLSKTIIAGREQTLDVVKDCYTRYGVKSVSVTSLTSVQTQTLITVTVSVKSVQDVTQDTPVFSTWQLDYQKSGSTWILEKITSIAVGNTSSDQLEVLSK